MENTTRDKILYSSFKLFLENGYEATNVRDICKEVGIRASTMYFYFKSKQDLFFVIYDEICSDYINHINNKAPLINDTSLKSSLLDLFKQKVEYYASDISKRKFIFRYHLFPPEEILSELREKYRFYTSEENKIIINVINRCQTEEQLRRMDLEGFLFEYKRLENHFVYEMITSSIMIDEKTVDNLWEVFWSSSIS